MADDKGTTVPPPPRFTTLPERVAFDEMVEEQPDGEVQPDTAPDPNTEVGWRWGG